MNQPKAGYIEWRAQIVLVFSLTKIDDCALNEFIYHLR